MSRCTLLFSLCCLIGAVLPACAAESAAKAVGLTLQAMDKADQDAIAEQLGKRAGVMVAAVAANSAAAKAGFVQGEVILKIGEAIVDSPAMADAALVGKTGALEVVSFILDDEVGIKVMKRTLALPGTAVKAEQPARQPDAETQKKLKALDDAHKAGIISDDEYAKKRAELLKGQPAATPATASKYIAPTKGQTYNHAVGFSFWYPAGWTVKDIADALQLAPDKPAVANGQPAEMYFISGQPLEGTGITQVTDPQIAAFLDQFIQQKVSPAMQRKKAPVPLAMMNGQGLLFDWDAPGQNGGTVVARVYACVLKGWGVMFCAIGAKEHVFNRQDELKAIFTSFGFEAGKQDPAVAGTWSLTATRTMRNEDNVNFTSDDPRRATAVSDEQITVQLNADGTVTRTSLYRMIAGGGAAGGAGKVWIDTGDQKTVTQGRWNANNGTLVLMWQDGAMESYRYGLVPQGNGAPAMKLLSGNQVQFWQRR
jgi:hypothetical protein